MTRLRCTPVDVLGIEGKPSPSEEKVVRDALGHFIEAERRARRPSVWLRAGRAQGRRLGMSDYRDRFDRADAWRLSTRFPFGGREYPGLHGRGDAK